MRIKFDGLAVAGDGVVQLLLTEEGIAKNDVGLGFFRIDFDGLAEAGDGLVNFPLSLQDMAKVKVCLDFFGSSSLALRYQAMASSSFL